MASVFHLYQLLSRPVPSAAAIPCLAALPSGWSYGGGDIHSGEAVRQLNSLLRGEISAAETYRMAIEKVADSDNTTHGGLLREIQEEHGRAAQGIRDRIRELGGEASDSSGAWGAWAKTVQGTMNLFGDDKIRLIVRADDFGFSHASNMALERLIKSGLPVSVSIIMPGPWYQETVELLKRHPAVSVGIHLTLNSEWKNYRWGPVSGRSAVPTLVDSTGFFFPSSAALHANKPDLREVELDHLRHRREVARVRAQDRSSTPR